MPQTRGLTIGFQFCSVSRDGDTERQRFGAEIQSPIRLVAIQEAKELKDAVLVGPLFDTQKLTVLIRRDGTEINAAVESSHQKLAVFELGNQGSSHRPQAVAEEPGKVTQTLRFGAWDAIVSYGVWAR